MHYFFIHRKQVMVSYFTDISGEMFGSDDQIWVFVWELCNMFFELDLLAGCIQLV